MEVDPKSFQMNVTCVNHEWRQSFQIECMTQCNPECQNGGECLQGNHCKCKDEYFGHRCEFKKCLGTPYSLTIERFNIR